MSEDTTPNLALNLSCYQIFGFDHVPVHRVFSECPYTPQRRDCVADFETVLSYYNNTSRPVSVLYRDGRVIVFKAYDRGGSRSQMSTAFVVRTNHRADANLMSHTAKMMHEFPQRGASLSGQHFVKQVQDNDAKRHTAGNPFNNWNFNRTQVSTEITLADLEAHGGVMYVPDLDIVVTTRVDLENLHHPYGPRANILTAQALARQAIEDQGRSIGREFIGIPLLIDNANQCPTAYFVDKMNNRVAALQAVKNPDMKDGLYYTRPVASKQHGAPSELKVETFYYPTIEDVPKDLLLIFRRYAEAENARSTPEEIKARQAIEDARIKSEALSRQSEINERDYLGKIDLLERQAAQRVRDDELAAEKYRREKGMTIFRTALGSVTLTTTVLKVLPILLALFKKPAS